MAFKDKLAGAKRRTKDVDVLLDGTLLARREELMQAVVDAKRGPKRTSDPRTAKALTAVAEFDAEIQDQFTTIRVTDVGTEKWRGFQIANPMEADQEKRDFNQLRHGYDVFGAAVDAIEASGLYVEGDETSELTPKEWEEFFLALNHGDLIRLTNAVVEVNETSGAQGYAAIKKASTTSPSSSKTSE